MRVAEGLAAGVLQPIPAIIILRAFRAGASTARRWASSASASCSRRRSGRASAACWSSGSAGARSSSSSSPFCLLALALARRYLPIGAPGGGRVKPAGVRLDVVGLGADRDRGPRAAQRHGAPAWRDPLGAAAGPARRQRRRRRSASSCISGAARQPLMALACSATARFAMGGMVAFIYGMALFGSTYLVPVFMQEALHAAAVAGRRGAAAGRHRARGDDSARRPARRPASRVSRIVSAAWFCSRASFFLMLGRGPAHRARADHGVGGDRPHRPRLHPAVAEPRLDARACRDALIAQGSSTINFLRQLGGAAGIGLVGVFLAWRLEVAGSPTSLRAFHEAFVLLGVLTAAAAFAARGMKRARHA